MELKRLILAEHSKAQGTKIADYVGTNKTRFKELVEVYLSGPYRITQRAAWPLSICVQHYPTSIRPHLTQILDYVNTPDVDDAVTRNTMRLLQYVEIPVRYHGQVADICFGFLQKKQTPVAVNVFSMTVLSRIIKDEPDFKRELKVIIGDLCPTRNLVSYHGPGRYFGKLKKNKTYLPAQTTAGQPLAFGSVR